jgi:hypothetical protein
MARFEIGEVLLTATMSEVFLCLGDAVLPWDSALRQRHAKGELVQIGQAGSLAQRQPTVAIKATGQFNLHMPLAFPRPKGQARKGLLVQFKRYAHKIVLPLPY